MPVRVLFLAANPLDTDRLRLDEEIRTIDHRLREGDAGREIELESFWAVRATDLSEALLRTSPHIVHFSGHGTVEGIVLEGRDGNAAVVPRDALAGLFDVLSDDIECVVFNACFAEDQAKAVADHIPAVVGTTRAITDEGALAFAAGFYRAIAYGRSIEDAFLLGKNEVALLGLPDEGTFQLLGEASSAVDSPPRPSQADAPVLAGATRSGSVGTATRPAHQEPDFIDHGPPPAPPPRRRWLAHAGFGAAAIAVVVALVAGLAIWRPWDGGVTNAEIENEIRNELDKPDVQGLFLFRAVTDVDVDDDSADLVGFVDAAVDIEPLKVAVQRGLDTYSVEREIDVRTIGILERSIAFALEARYPSLVIVVDPTKMLLEAQVSTDDQRTELANEVRRQARALAGSPPVRTIDIEGVVSAETEMGTEIAAVLVGFEFEISDGVVLVHTQAGERLRRDAMAAIFVETLGLPEGDRDYFIDDNGTRYEAEINALARAGVTIGCNPPTDNRYCPDRLVTRGEMAAFLVRHFKYSDDGGGRLFVDTGDSVFRGDIDRIATAGVDDGCNSTQRQYCPTRDLTRAEMVTALLRALEIVD